MQQQLLPQPGQLVVVRTRLAQVQDVRVHSHPATGGSLHLVDVDYLDERRFPEADTVVWEREVGAQVVSRIRVPAMDEGQPDPPDRYQAFLDAMRWSAVNRLQDPDRPDADSQLVFSPWYGAVQVEKYQLYPVLKALSMPRISLLLADDVGLGKTVEAGLILSELIARRRARRVLVICPASIQLQWEEELRTKFNLDFKRMDRASGEALMRELGSDANPWAGIPRIITSMDYLRQPNVLEQFRTAAASMYRGDSGVLPWDLLIVDEAHNFVPGHYHDVSQRYLMLHEVAAQFEHRLFLTATPHNGFTVSFTGLLELLDPVRFQQKAELNQADHSQIKAVMVRRLKSELNDRSARPLFANRFVQGLPVQLHPREQTLYRALQEYRDQAAFALSSSSPAERSAFRFVFSLLTKRLLSSSYAFARTWWAHIEGLSDLEGDLATLQTAVVRAETVIEDDDEKAARELDVVRHGAAWLQQHRERLSMFIKNVSRAVEELGWSKEHVEAEFGPWLPKPPDGRWDSFAGWIHQHLYANNRLRGDERLIVFTEYRDTQSYLLWRLRETLQLDQPVVMPLYGGASLDLREAIKAQFNESTSPLRILVATDAASEGLNLQESCRYVLHQEIPWNPMRLEQRNGRVDRHGQARDVTIFHFTSDEHADMAFLSYVVSKVDQVRDDLGSVGQVFDHLIQTHFDGGNADVGQAEMQLDQATATNDAKADLANRDTGEDVLVNRRLGELHLQERSLGLSAQNLGRLFREAVNLAGGQVETSSNESVFRLAVAPSSWKRLLEENLRGPDGRIASSMPKITFDQRLFEEEVNGRRIFRPLPDTVLIRLGHPIMRRALSTLRQSLWEDGPIRRWTVVSGGPDLPYEAVMVVWVLATALNELRETVHEEVIGLPFSDDNGNLLALDERFWAELSRETLIGLPLDTLAFWQDRLRERWVEYRRQILQLLEKRKTAEKARVEGWLSAWKTRESDREAASFALRLEELEQGVDVRTMEKVQKRLIKAEQVAIQTTFDEEENSRREGRVAQLRRELDAASFELQHSHRQALRHQLELDRERVLTQVIPKRFTLAHFDLYPLAAELRVRSSD
ncbi:MAG: DISARM system SNF2-like helicase DrmD [Thermoleophilia bacterium]